MRRPVRPVAGNADRSLADRRRAALRHRAVRSQHHAGVSAQLRAPAGRAGRCADAGGGPASVAGCNRMARVAAVERHGPRIANADNDPHRVPGAGPHHTRCHRRHRRRPQPALCRTGRAQRPHRHAPERSRRAHWRLRGHVAAAQCGAGGRTAGHPQGRRGLCAAGSASTRGQARPVGRGLPGPRHRARGWRGAALERSALPGNRTGRATDRSVRRATAAGRRARLCHVHLRLERQSQGRTGAAPGGAQPGARPGLRPLAGRRPLRLRVQPGLRLQHAGSVGAVAERWQCGGGAPGGHA